MDQPPSDPGDSDGAAAFVTPREDPPISLAVAEDTDSIDIIDDDNSSITMSPDQMGSSNVILTKAFVSARGSPESVREQRSGRMMATEAASSRISMAPSVEWLDAYSEILSDPDDIMVVNEEDNVDGIQSVEEESLLTR